MAGLWKDTAWFTCAILVLVATLLLNAHFASLYRSNDASVAHAAYSFVEYDFPPTLIPLAEFPYNAETVTEDTIYYQFTADDEWNAQFPSSGGFVRMGPDHRIFGVSMFHQLHCLNRLRVAVTHMESTEYEELHVQHCLNYLRQMILCASSTRLEPLRETEGGLVTHGLGLAHTCRDWSRLHASVEENYQHWP